ncbi:MAG: hypothetical protein ACI89T_000461 [Cognaticolwellia sp.]|jgi:hypothetical protein
MQPYIFPYLGYYQLIHHTDKWVVFDDIQFSSKSWVNRNRILHPEQNKAWQYFTIPIKKHSLSTKINELDINYQLAWKEQILGKLSHYKNRAPFYRQTINLINEVFDTSPCKLNNLLVNALKITCNYLDIDFNYQLFSELNFDESVISSPGDWALHISKKLNASEYINPPGGYSIFSEQSFLNKNIKLSFLTSDLPDYNQNRKPSIPALSIIDVMMWNSVTDIKNMLKQYKLQTFQELSKNDKALEIK